MLRCCIPSTLLHPTIGQPAHPPPPPVLFHPNDARWPLDVRARVYLLICADLPHMHCGKPAPPSFSTFSRFVFSCLPTFFFPVSFLFFFLFFFFFFPTYLFDDRSKICWKVNYELVGSNRYVCCVYSFERRLFIL